METFIKEKEKQKRLVYILIIILVLGIIFVLWYFFFRNQAGLELENEAEILLPKFVEKPVDINLQILENPLLEELVLFEEIPAFEGNIGRKNPFTTF